MELLYLFSAHPLIMLYILIKLCESISKSFRVTDSKIRLTLRWSQFTKGHNSVNTVGGVMLPVLCTSSDDALLILYNISNCFRVTE